VLRSQSASFCFLTFDDGKKSNVTETAPVLRELGAPAAFYIPTRFLSRGNRPLRFDRYKALCAHVPDLPAALRVEALKALPLCLRDQRLDDACQRYGVDADMTNDDIRPMSWDDVRFCTPSASPRRGAESVPPLRYSGSQAVVAL
jgi:hypothetical protein